MRIAKNINLWLISFLFSGIYSAFLFPAFSQVQNGSKNPVRIDIANGGLHCPFLGPRLKEKISKLDGAENIELNSRDSYIEFTLPEANKISTDELAKLAVDVGYPAKDVKVTVFKKEMKQ